MGLDGSDNFSRTGTPARLAAAIVAVVSPDAVALVVQGVLDVGARPAVLEAFDPSRRLVAANQGSSNRGSGLHPPAVAPLKLFRPGVGHVAI
jgi:hypothetical protein